jgi:hypothetical protein
MGKTAESETRPLSLDRAVVSSLPASIHSLYVKTNLLSYIYGVAKNNKAYAVIYAF